MYLDKPNHDCTVNRGRNVRNSVGMVTIKNEGLLQRNIRAPGKIPIWHYPVFNDFVWAFTGPSTGSRTVFISSPVIEFADKIAIQQVQEPAQTSAFSVFHYKQAAMGNAQLLPDEYIQNNLVV